MPLTVAIDIDGVIAPVANAREIPDKPGAFAPQHDDNAWPDDQYIYLTEVKFGTLVARPVCDLLMLFAAHPGIEPMWHSSWRESATKELAPALGVGETWPQLASVDEYRQLSGWWKLEAVRRWLADHDRADQRDAHLLWIDDDASDAVAFGEIEQALVDHLQLTIITPNVFVGLTPEDLERITALIRRHA